MKTILITHNDLDAAGCAILFKCKFPDIEIVYDDYKKITDITKELIRNRDKYDKIFFADISPEEAEAKVLIKDDKFVIIDHHIARSPFLEGLKTFDTRYCAALIAENYLGFVSQGFILKIDAWDTWKLDSPWRKEGEDLNLLFGYYGMKKFIYSFRNGRDINEMEKTILEVLRKQKNDYLEQKMTQTITKTDDDGNNYWEVYIGEPQSGLGQIMEIAKEKQILPEDVKYIKCINPNDKLISLYSLGFDVSKIVGKYGGGGHTKASGYHYK